MTDQKIITYPDTGVTMKVIPQSNNKVFVDIFYPRANVNEEENIAETSWLRDEFSKLEKKYPGKKFLFLLDLTKPGNAELIADESMEIYVNLLKHPSIIRVATFGQTRWYSIIINIMVKLSKTYGKLRYFSDREKAYEWLMNNKNDEDI